MCGAALTTDRALACPCGGYPIARHNEIRDRLAEVMREVVKGVETEPTLLPYQGGNLLGRSSNRSAGARLDIQARRFCSRQQDAFFDVRVTHPKASLLSRSEVLSQLQAPEKAKKRTYCDRVNRVDRGAFTPLVFSTSGMCAEETTLCLKALASQLVEKHSELAYSVVMGELRSLLSFTLLRWAITCFRGCRGSYGRRRDHGFLHRVPVQVSDLDGIKIMCFNCLIVSLYALLAYL